MVPGVTDGPQCPPRRLSHHHGRRRHLVHGKPPFHLNPPAALPNHVHQHFVGNRAIVLADGQPSLQISYSAGFTVLSFFVPILVLLIAFTAIGAHSNTTRTPWARLLAGGSLAGCAICGMHYLGDASISNYGSEYDVAYIVGSAIIAVAASNVALAVFFVFRHAWANSWWKTLASGVVLAGAVSGMHWCGVMGTRYRLKKVTSEGTTMSINKSVIAVIVLVGISEWWKRRPWANGVLVGCELPLDGRDGHLYR